MRYTPPKGMLHKIRAYFQLRHAKLNNFADLARASEILIYRIQDVASGLFVHSYIKKLVADNTQS